MEPVTRGIKRCEITFAFLVLLNVMCQALKRDFYAPVDLTHVDCLLSNSPCSDWSPPAVPMVVHLKANLEGRRKWEELPPLKSKT